MLTPDFDPNIWAAVPFHFWSLVCFVFGSMVGSFLNVCIHRLPLGQSIVSPPSHCPHCKYSIPWYLNVPLFTWLYLRGKCRNCGAPIAIRYFLVELLTAVTFLCCWLTFGGQSAALALVYALFLSGLIAATFIDFEHFIIPDEITIGGMVAGFACSFLLPALHGQVSPSGGLRQSLLGMGIGAGIIYLILRVGKLLFGRQRVTLPADAKVVFSETAVHLPDSDIPYEDLFYRRSDVIAFHARTLELADRGYKDVRVRLSPDLLRIGEEELNPQDVPYLAADCTEIVLPREAMGLGDVKFMAAIGAFLGWQAVLFSLMVSSMIGSVVGVALILLRKREWSSRLPYGPYIALAAAIWIFGGKRLVQWWFGM
ncbi:MAG TPA: prepilin peptidase [Verrucomicrobiota bacterium]|jgi:leader peptidase (prepilin peptidase)/N-methyltransferase|nr:prepilin peptidase [Verrucomicrobiota bacterium]HQL78733.1 prepilin peptidase [Verrucomicrobiota bacterium]